MDYHERGEWPKHPKDPDNKELFACFVCHGTLHERLYVMLTDWCIGVGGERFTRHDMSDEDNGPSDEGDDTYYITGICLHAECVQPFLETQVLSERFEWNKRHNQG